MREAGGSLISTHPKRQAQRLLNLQWRFLQRVWRRQGVGLRAVSAQNFAQLSVHLGIFVLRKLCITQHHLCFPYPFFHLVNFPSLRAQVFAHRQAFEALFSACTQFLGALMPSSPTALAATNAAPSTNCPAQTTCAAAACSSSDPGNAL